jgi:hypothetical protein
VGAAGAVDVQSLTQAAIAPEVQVQPYVTCFPSPQHSTRDGSHGYGQPVGGPLSQFTETRVIDGTARFQTSTGTTTGTFSMRVTDRGEPGTSDWFYLTMSFGSTSITIGPYTLGGANGGNIQLHHVCLRAPLP